MAFPTRHTDVRDPKIWRIISLQKGITLTSVCRRHPLFSYDKKNSFHLLAESTGLLALELVTDNLESSLQSSLCVGAFPTNPVPMFDDITWSLALPTRWKNMTLYVMYTFFGVVVSGVPGHAHGDAASDQAVHPLRGQDLYALQVRRGGGPGPDPTVPDGAPGP